jgi:Putative beta-lactamase-inhibitor-like, PepSY-like
MRKLLFGLAAVVGTMILGSAVKADEIDLAKIPKKVQTVLQKEYPGAELVVAFREEEEKEVFYNVVLKFKNHEYEVTLTPKGEILEIAKQLPAKDLPPPVTKAIHKAYPKAKIKEAEEVTEPGQTVSVTYHVEVFAADGRTLEVIFDPMGTVLKEDVRKEKK